MNDHRAAIDITCIGPLSLKGIRPGLVVSGEALDGSAPEWKRLNNEGIGCWNMPGQWDISLDFKPHEDLSGGLLYCRVTNLSAQHRSIDEVLPCIVEEPPSGASMDRCLTNGIDMVSLSRLVVLSGEEISYSVIGFTDACGDHALVFGFLGLDTAFFRFDAWLGNGETRKPFLSAACLREGIVLEAGASLNIPPVWIGARSSLSTLMDRYAEASARMLKPRIGEPPTGWCSWYYYYDSMTADDLYLQMDNLHAEGFGERVEYIQIDDGWNLPSRFAPRNWGDWEAGGLFPGGMKQVADDIKEKGFKPGLWLAPFSVDPASRLFCEHPELLIGGDDGPADSWGVYGLDLSHPGSLEFLRSTFARVFDQWGFEYIKIDFLLHAVIPGKRYNPAKTSAELLREGLAVIREAAGDKYILGCGCPMGPAIGMVDGMRIGYDISSRWYIPLNLGSWPLGNCCVRPAMVQHAWRNWMHRRWWVNDADCLLVRDFGSPFEIENFKKHFPTLADPPYGLAGNEAEAWAQLVWLTGGIAMIGEDVSALSQERKDLLRTFLEVHIPGVRWVDWYENPEVPVFCSEPESGSWYAAIFNITDEPVSLSIPAEKFGLGGSWVLKNILDGKRLSGSGNMICFPQVSARTGMVWVREQ